MPRPSASPTHPTSHIPHPRLPHGHRLSTRRRTPGLASAPGSQIQAALLARHQLPTPPASGPPPRLAWHPSYDFVLAVSCGTALYFVNVPPTSDVAAAPEYAAAVLAAAAAPGAAAPPAFTCLAWSPGGGLLAAGDAAGYVAVWPLAGEALDPGGLRPLPAEPELRFQVRGMWAPRAESGCGAGWACVGSREFRRAGAWRTRAAAKPPAAAPEGRPAA
jgi:hypothetical protein